MMRPRPPSPTRGIIPSISRRRGTSSSMTGSTGKDFIKILWSTFFLVFSMTLLMTIFSINYMMTTTPPINNSNNNVDQKSTTTTSSMTTKKKAIIPSASWTPPSNGKQVLSKIQEEFNTRYGSLAPTLLEKGISVFGSIDATAERMVEASQVGRPFVMAFSGYSVTVGRGNFFNQSFPFEVERILSQPMKDLLGIPLIVRNAAIGGIPSFPYSFCLEHFVGDDPDILSWDYSMNEGQGASVLEAFIRQSLQQLSKRPMILMLDKNRGRSQLLQNYVKKGLLADAMTIGRKEDLPEISTFLTSNVPEKQSGGGLPPGFQQWDEFGAPPNCPGRGTWHPKRQEHSMIGWMIAMHFIEVLERAYDMLLEGPSTSSASLQFTKRTSRPMFPKQLSPTLDNDPEVNELLFGHKTDQGQGSDGEEQYIMKDLSCRSSFIPTTDETKTLPSIIVSGFAEEDTNMDIMIERTKEQYQKGWVLDVSKVERDTKRKVEQCGGLGYLDMKIALYGTGDSGTLRLWLPFEGPSHEHHEHSLQESDEDVDAKHWFDDFLLCEANEKRPEKACKLHQDMDITVGGISIYSTIHEVKGAAEYLKRKTCINVGIPIGAKITTLGQVTTIDGRLLSVEEKIRLRNGNNHDVESHDHDDDDDNAVGIIVDVTPKSKVTLEDGACCLSHVVWEMH